MYFKKQKAVAWIIWIVFLLVTLFSIFFVAMESNHDCSGENCSVCMAIETAEQTLRQFGSAVIVADVMIFVRIAAFLVLAIGYICNLPHITPIARKVRLND